MNKISVLILPLAAAVILAGCSTTKETQKTEVVVKPKPPVVIPVKKPVKNNPLEERQTMKKFKVESIDKLRFDYDENGGLQNKGKLSLTKYDDNGLMTETQFFDDKGKLDYKYGYKYDKKLNLIETVRYNKRGGKDKRYAYEYNKDGNRTKAYRYNTKDILEKYYIYLYDEAGNLVKEEWYDKSGKLEYTIVNKYDSNDRKIESLNYEGKDKLVVKYLFKYDNNNNTTEEIKHDADGNATGVIQYLYKYSE